MVSILSRGLTREQRSLLDGHVLQMRVSILSRGLTREQHPCWEMGSGVRVLGFNPLPGVNPGATCELV